jgi:non-canonical (house-cleaning) NTP pyrophosphatase
VNSWTWLGIIANPERRQLRLFWPSNQPAFTVMMDLREKIQLTDKDVNKPIAPLEMTDELRTHIKLEPWNFSLNSSSDNIAIVVPTENSRKVDTVKAVVQRTFGLRCKRLWAQDADSGEGSQPWTPSGGIRGACGRINSVRKALSSDEAYKRFLRTEEIGQVLVVSLENFVDDTHDPPVDYTFIIIYNTSGDKYKSGFSEGCIFPSRYLEAAKRRGTTIGKLIAENNHGVQHDDPHQKLCGESRYALITNALKALMEQRGYQHRTKSVVD